MEWDDKGHQLYLGRHSQVRLGYRVPVCTTLHCLHKLIVDLQILNKFIDFLGDIVRSFATQAPYMGPSEAHSTLSSGSSSLVVEPVVSSGTGHIREATVISEDEGSGGYTGS